MCNSKRAFGAVTSIILGFWALAGCNVNPMPDGTIGGSDNNNAGDSQSTVAPAIHFDSPSDNTTVPDNATLSIKYTVTTSRAMTSTVSLDPDGTPDNGNEVVVASDRNIDPQNGSDQVDLVAGRYPYGKYFVRVKLTDGTNTYDYSSLSTVNVVPLLNDSAAG